LRACIWRSGIARFFDTNDQGFTVRARLAFRAAWVVQGGLT
jgi:hypothetical protein